jgi:hypothetical protein
MVLNSFCEMKVTAELNLMHELGIELDFKDSTIGWDGAIMPFRGQEDTYETGFYLAVSGAVLESVEQIKQILDAKYVKIDIDQYVTEFKPLLTAQQKARIFVRRDVGQLEQ